jgi:hypothetical protein
LKFEAKSEERRPPTFAFFSSLLQTPTSNCLELKSEESLKFEGGVPSIRTSISYKQEGGVPFSFLAIALISAP